MLGQSLVYKGYFSAFSRSDALYSTQQQQQQNHMQLKSGMSSHNGPVETQHQSFMNGIPNHRDFSLPSNKMGSEGISNCMMDNKSTNRREGKPEDLMQELAKLAQSSGGSNILQKAVQNPEPVIPVIKQEPGVTTAPVPPHPPPQHRPRTPTQSPDQTSPNGNTAHIPDAEAEKEVNNLLNVALANKAGRTIHGSPFKEGSPLPVPPLIGHFTQTPSGYPSQVPPTSAQISPLVPPQLPSSIQEPSTESTESDEKQDQSPDLNDSGNDEQKLYIDEGSSEELSPQNGPNSNLYQRSNSEDVSTSGQETSNTSPILASQTSNEWGQPAPPLRNSSMESNWDGVVSTTQEDGTERYYCHLCSYVGSSQYLFKAHMNSHFEHNCPHCDYTSRTEGRLKKHIKDFHTDAEGGTSPNRSVRTTPGRPKLFRCKQCEYVSATKEDFWSHSRVHIKTEKILQCPKCPFVTEYKHHLEYHLRNHFGSKPFKCEKCNYSCVNKSMLNSHMKSHTNVYQYRCADCTYATKYCHSLKLHLQKYNHKPATVLNLDGSLPIDGTGDFDLVSKRGPPRGPRGPRNDQTPPAGSMKNMLPHMGVNPLNGAMMPAPFWPLMGQMPNGFNGPPPLIPVHGMNPLNVTHPGAKLTSPPGGAVNPMMPGMKCNWCDFVTHNPEKLNLHILKVHAAEHQDLFSVFGIRAEALMEEQAKQAKMMMMQMHAANTEQMKKILGSPKAGGMPFPLVNKSPLAHKENSMKTPEKTESKKFNGPEKSPKPRYQQSEEARTGEKGEHPLDLSRPYPSYYDEDSSEMMYEETEDPSGGTEEQRTPKRPIADDNSGMPVRKRSRKGKAYKLDTLCRRLQERGSLSPSRGESEDEYPADYGSEGMGGGQDEADIYTNPNSAESGSQDDGQRSPDDYTESDQQKDLQSNLNELHASIRALNGDATENAGQNITPKVEENRSYSLYHQNEHITNGHETDECQTNSKTDDMNKLPGKHGSNYECHFCGIAFRDCVMYTMHMGYHGYKDPFKCNMCGHQSGNKVEFFLHIARAAHD